MTDHVHIQEVGLRDGLQSIATTMPTEAKKRWISAAYDAGLRQIEVTSFVPPRLLPQLADAAQIVDYALQFDGLTVTALVPNLKGAENALRPAYTASWRRSLSVRSTAWPMSGAHPWRWCRSSAVSVN